ncbi:MAG: 6,7-dimethyl-8-ribityllumazine synthase [Thermodesulfobacteriota bacterium]
MPRTYEGVLKAEGLKFAIISSRFNDFVGDKLIQGALEALTRTGARDEDVDIIKVPGSFEIPQAARLAVDSDKYDAVICLGAVIRGATPHFEYVAAEVSKGVARISLESKIPVVYGILTTDNIEQAIERAGTKGGNKGWDAALTAVEMVNLFKAMGSKKR